MAAMVFFAAEAQAVRAGEPGSGVKPKDVVVRKNIVYRELAKGEFLPTSNQLDVYVPKDAKDFPVILLVHGGAWVGGDKTFDRIPDVAQCLAHHGIGVVAPNYRLSPFFQHPAHVTDVAKALAWTKQHIGDYGGSTDRMILMGHSAGGHLVALLASDESYLKAEGLDRRDVKGVIGISGVYQVSDVPLKVLVKNSTLNLDLALKTNPFTLVFGKDAEVCRLASPLTHVCEGLPPFLILYAADDLPTLGEMAETFDAALRAKQCECQLCKVADRNHLSIFRQARTADDCVCTAVREFVQKRVPPAK
jgi:acetyl esterase/lipase